MHAQSVSGGKSALCLAHGLHVGDQATLHMGRTFLHIRGVVFEHHDLFGALEREAFTQCTLQQRIGHAGVVLVNEAPVSPHEQAFTSLGLCGRMGRWPMVTGQNFFKQGLRLRACGFMARRGVLLAA